MGVLQGCVLVCQGRIARSAFGERAGLGQVTSGGSVAIVRSGRQRFYSTEGRQSPPALSKPGWQSSPVAERRPAALIRRRRPLPYFRTRRVRQCLSGRPAAAGSLWAGRPASRAAPSGRVTSALPLDSVITGSAGTQLEHRFNYEVFRPGFYRDTRGSFMESPTTPG